MRNRALSPDLLGAVTGSERVPARWVLPSGVLLTGVYFAAGKLGLSLATEHGSVSAVWPPTGIALAGLMLLGYRVWPAVFLGALLVNLTNSGHVPTSLGIAAGNTLEGLAGAALVNRFAGGLRAFERPWDVLRFVLVALASPVVSATIGVVSLDLGGLASWADSGGLWLTWWLGDVGGALVVAPFFLCWAADPRPRWSRLEVLELTLLLVGLLAVGLLVFFRGQSGTFGSPLKFLCLPLVLWTAFRFGQREVATFTLLLAAIAVTGTLRAIAASSVDDQGTALLILQAFLGVMAATAAAVGAVVSQHRRTQVELRGAQDELEQRVQRRTAELSLAIEVLEKEAASRQRADEQLRQSEARFEGLLESAPDAMVIVDVRGDIVVANAQAERLFGYAREELLGRSVEVLVPSRFRDAHVLHRTAYSKDPRTRRMGEGLELFGRRKDGSEFPVEIALSPLQTAEGLLVSSAIRDISASKAAEAEIRQLNAELERRVEERTAELRRSNEDLEQFAYIASHDLQEPLRMVSSYLQLLERRCGSALDARAREFMGFAVDGSKHMRMLIDALLQYSRAGAEGLAVREFPAEQAVSRAVQNLATVVGETRAQVRWAELPVIEADFTQLVEVFQNLIGNALKFRGVRRPVVTVSAEREDGEWVFRVADNGIGIDPRCAERIFELFQRLHARNEYPGSGIGLAICRKIVERHGGSIRLESSSAEGSTFAFTIPARARSGAASPGAGAAEA